MPGVNIVTTEFVDGVTAQSESLGFAPAVVYVPHPIQNRTPEELRKIADETVEPALRLLTQA